MRKQRAKRFRSNSYGLPASSLLLLAWRLKKNGAAPQQGRFSRASASEPCFRPEVENHSRGTKIDARQPEAAAGPCETRRAPGGNRARDHPLQRDGRKTTGPPAPRRGPAAPAAHARAEAPTQKARKFSALQNLAPNLDLSSEADSEARKTHAELKNKLQEAPVLGAPARPFWL